MHASILPAVLQQRDFPTVTNSNFRLRVSVAISMQYQFHIAGTIMQLQELLKVCAKDDFAG